MCRNRGNRVRAAVFELRPRSGGPAGGRQAEDHLGSIAAPPTHSELDEGAGAKCAACFEDDALASLHPCQC